MLGTSEAYITYLIYGDRRDDAWVQRICQALDMQEKDDRQTVEIAGKM